MGQTKEEVMERELRVDMAAGFRWLDRWGMDDLAAGSIVARLAGETEWLLTHSQGVYFDEIKASDFMRVSFDNEVLDGTNQRTNYAAVNPAAWIFRARPDVNVVVHAHPHAVMAVSALKCGILPISAPAYMFQTGISWMGTDFHFKDEYCKAVGEALGDNNVLMYRNHSFVSVGRTVHEAMFLAYYLNEACELQMKILSTNQEINIPSDEELASHARSYTADNSRQLEYDGSMEWPGLLRKLDREEPSYRD